MHSNQLVGQDTNKSSISTTAPKETQIAKQISELDSMISNLQLLTDELILKLNPVVIIQQAEESSHKSAPVEALVPLADMLRGFNYRILSISSAISITNQNLEL